MPEDVYSRVTVVRVQPSAIDPATAGVVTQYALLKLPSGVVVKVFEGAREHAFNAADVGVSFVLLFYLDAGDRYIERVDTPRKSFSQSDHTATIEGTVVAVEPDTAERSRVFVDTGECRVYFFASVPLRRGDSVRASGRLEVREKHKV